MLWGADVLICDLKLLLPKIQLFRTEYDSYNDLCVGCVGKNV